MIIDVSGVLFDMDGVLVSSIGSVTRCWRQWAIHYGVPDAEHLEVQHGMRAVDIIGKLKPDLDRLEGLRFIEDLEIADTADLTVLPGAGELLRSLPAERWAIVTSATRRLLLGRLTAAGLPVPERLISADMVRRGKPDPEPYVRGAELLGVSPAHCLVVEDAPSGVRAGLTAGCRVLGVAGTHPPAELREAGVTWVVNSLEAVRAEVVSGEIRLHFEPLESWS